MIANTMRHSRIYHNGSLQIGQPCVLDTHKSHYVSTVLRLKPNDALILFNGQGGEFNATIKSIDRRSVILTVNSFLDASLESPLRLHLGQGISRGERMDFVLQKAVELGVNEITPLITERCNVRLKEDRRDNKINHWKAIIESACEQCGRNQLPILNEPVSLADWLSKELGQLKLLLNHQAEKKLSSIKNCPAATTDITLLIGPEGGLSEKETELAEQQHFQSVQLGRRVLRTETAALAALSALQILFGDF